MASGVGVSSVDRGYAWVILAAAFGIQLLAVGTGKAFGFLYTEFLDRFQTSAGATAWIMSMNFALLLGTGSISTTLGAVFTYRLVIIIGGVFIAIGFICSAFVERMEVLYVTYGLVTGLGFGLVYAPTVVMASVYFDKRKALANGITVSGNSIGYFFWPFIHRGLLAEYSLFGTLLITGAICLNVCALGALMRPLPGNQRTEKIYKDIREPLGRNQVEYGIENEQETKLFHQNIDDGDTSTIRATDEKVKPETKGQRCRTMCTKFIPDYTFLSNPIFWVYLVAFSFASLGYPSNLMVVPPYAESCGMSLDSVATILSICGLADLCGRIGIGWLSDMQFLSRRYIFALCMMFSGLSAFVAPFATTFTTIVIYGVWFGFFGGSYWAMLAVLLSDVFGKERLAAAVGLLLSLIALPVLVAPPFLGWLKDVTGDWSLSLRVAGVFMVLAAITVMLEPIARRFEDKRTVVNTSEPDDLTNDVIT